MGQIFSRNIPDQEQRISENSSLDISHVKLTAEEKKKPVNEISEINIVKENCIISLLPRFY